VKKQQKVEIVQQLKEELGASQAAVVVEYKGITVESFQGLRKQLREREAGVRVVKNTLLLRAVDGTPNARLKDLVGGPIAVAYTSSDPAILAKEIVAYGRKEKLLVIRGGVLGGKTIDAEGVGELATLPTLDEMRARALGMLSAPAQQLLSLLLAAPRNFLGVLQAKVDQEESANN